MAQYDVFTLADGMCVVDVQSDIIRATGTRVVIPLIELGDDTDVVDRLTLRLSLDGGDLLLATHLMTAVLERELRGRIGSLADQDDAIKISIDMLISGF